MDFYGSHFEFKGTNSNIYGLILANVETDRFIQVSGTMSSQYIFNKKERKRYIASNVYRDSPISFDIDIVSDSETPIDSWQRRKIEKWLFRDSNYGELRLNSEDDCADITDELIEGVAKGLFIKCRFLNPSKLEYNGGIVGYRATLEMDSSLAWQDPIVKEYKFTHNSNTATTHISVPVDTDIDGYTYPIVKIQADGTGGDISLINNKDDSSRITKFISVPPNGIFTIDGSRNYVSGNYYERFYMAKFPRLLDGNNDISVIGHVASVSIEWSNRRRF